MTASLTRQISKCGDSILDAENDEECDDGNQANDDDCTSESRTQVLLQDIET